MQIIVVFQRLNSYSSKKFSLAKYLLNDFMGETWKILFTN